MSPKLAVVQGAILKCDKGTMPSPLSVTTLSASQIVFQPVATIMDHSPGVNIKPFGACAEKKGPCVPETPIPWKPGEIGISLVPSVFPILSNVSLLPCAVGGIIEIITPGQSVVIIDSISNDDDDDDADEEGGFSWTGFIQGEFTWTGLILQTGFEGLLGGLESYSKFKQGPLQKELKRTLRKAEKKAKQIKQGYNHKVKNELHRIKDNERLKLIENARRTKQELLDKADNIKPKVRIYSGLKWGARFGGPALTGIQAVNQYRAGNHGGAAATVVGGVVGMAATTLCGAGAVALSVPTGGAAAVAGGFACGAVGAGVGAAATWGAKKIGKKTKKIRESISKWFD